MRAAEGKNEVIPLPTVDGKVFEKVIEWCTHHLNDEPKPVEELPKDPASVPAETKQPEISEWDQNFAKVDQGKMFYTLTILPFSSGNNKKTITSKHKHITNKQTNYRGPLPVDPGCQLS